MSPSKHKKSDKTTMISFAVNFCAMFALVFVIGLLLLAETFAGSDAGMASVSQTVRGGSGAKTANTECAPVAPAMLFPVSSPSPVETPAKISVDDSGFSTSEIDLSLSSSKSVRITNNGVNPHSFRVDALGVDSGVIKPGATVAVNLENLSPDDSVFEFYSAVAGDDRDGFRGTVVFK